MKKLLTIIAIALMASFGFSQNAEAGRLRIGFTSYYTSGHANCGCAIPYRKVFRGYGKYGAPYWNHYRQPIVHSCGHGSVYRTHGYYGKRRGYYRNTRRSYYRPRYRNRRSRGRT